jgi:Tol biopolymer transport system component
MNKRKFFVGLWGSVIVMLGLLAGAHATTAQGQAMLTLTPLEVGVAETGVIEGRIDCGATGCGGFKVTLSFDRTLLRAEEVAVGPYLGDQVFLADNTIDNAAGTVRLVAAAMAPPPAGADNVLFRLTVSGLKPGQTTVNVDSLEMTGLSGEAVPSTAQPSTVTVVETGKIAFFSPPQNGWEVAFVSERDGNPEIYVVSADGRNTRRLTDHPALDGGPTWSPSGDQIAFYTARDGNMEIYLMDANGGSLQRLTNDPAADTEPAWSADGSQIAFVSDRDGNPEIYVMNADGSDPHRLTDNPAADISPAWSPSGSEIAFASRRNGSAELFLMQKDGSGVQQFSNLFGANGWYPAWAPDARMLSFASERDNAADMYLIDYQGQNVQRLTQKTSALTSSDWSPDGGWIAYMAGYDGNADLFVLDSTGTDLFRLTDNPAEDYDPDWRPTRVGPCYIMIDTEEPQIEVRVGPGKNRGVFTTLPPYQDIRVIGQAYDDEQVVWWEIDKSQIPGGETANSLWVNSDDVLEKGDCPAVVRVEAPPIIPGAPPPVSTPPGTWGPCGSCECGHPGECVLAPDGQCLWDPATCGEPPPPPDDGGDCFSVSVVVNNPPTGAIGSVTLRPKPNCGRLYLPGTSITAVASPSNGFSGWGGSSCPVSGSNPTVTFTINASCTLVANW